MDRREGLEEDEDRADDRQRRREAVAALHRADEGAHRDREAGRQNPAQDERDPPRDGEPPVGLRQDAEELKFLGRAQPLERHCRRA